MKIITSMNETSLQNKIFQVITVKIFLKIYTTIGFFYASFSEISLQTLTVKATKRVPNGK